MTGPPLDDDFRRFAADLHRTDLVLVLSERMSYAVRLVENPDAATAEKVFDVDFLRLEARGPIGSETVYTWIASSQTLELMTDPVDEPPAQLAEQVRTVIEEWAAWRHL